MYKKRRLVIIAKWYLQNVEFNTPIVVRLGFVFEQSKYTYPWDSSSWLFAYILQSVWPKDGKLN